ncbi:MAG: hypothetical protein CM15mP12_5770 [Gammaproteobacteria bacterium]|nr:MAG: hypothetical protein CM15mP12_5770 [Gammaproteobacteria bacterium]
MSKAPCQFKLKFRSTNYCDQSSIFVLDENKKPVLTFSNDNENIYAHLADNKTTKIDIELEEYGILGFSDNNLWLSGDPSGNSNGVSILDIQTNKIRTISPKECHSLLNYYFTVNGSSPYASMMECDGKKMWFSLIQIFEMHKFYQVYQEALRIKIFHLVVGLRIMTKLFYKFLILLQ